MTETDVQHERRERRIQWERRFQSVMVTLVAGAIVWGVQTLVSVDKTLTVSVQRIDQVELVVAGMYRRDDALRDVAALGARVERMAAGVEAQTSALAGIQARVRVLEDRARVRRNHEAPAATEPRQ